MATGVGGHSEADLKRFLGDVDFPANRLDLVQHAHQRHADPQMIEQLEKMPNKEYESLDEVMEGFARKH